MATFYGWGSNASRLEPLRGGSLLFTTKVPEIPGTHFIDLGKITLDLSRPWSYPVVLNTGLLDWESSALTAMLIVVNSSYTRSENQSSIKPKFNFKVQTQMT